MRYVVARRKKYIEDMAYRIYITDSLMGIAKNTSRGQGMEMSRRYADIINVKEETRTPDEIIGNIKKKLAGGEEHG